MKLIIQIPCYNEAQFLSETIAQLPRRLPGIDQIEYLVIDDGSTDETWQVAAQSGVHHRVRLPINRGLAMAFQVGIETALRHNADIIVNTDADNQYNASDIEALLSPIVARQADMVIGIRPIERIGHFSWSKKKLQRLGSAIVRLISGTRIRDVTSGFRAFSREAALSFNLISQFTYTLETLIQVGTKNLRLVQVPIRVNPQRRKSRLFRSSWDYIYRSMSDVFRIYLYYRGDRFFAELGLAFIVPGLLIDVRYLILDSLSKRGGHLQSLILSAILILMGFQSWFIALFLRSQMGNRILLERLLSQSKMRM